MQTVIVKILNERALKELADLESKKLIKMESQKNPAKADWSKYVGSLKKSSLDELTRELELLRDDWE